MIDCSTIQLTMSDNIFNGYTCYMNIKDCVSLDIMCNYLYNSLYYELQLHNLVELIKILKTKHTKLHIHATLGQILEHPTHICYICSAC